MIDFTKLKEGQTVLFDFEGKTYERKVEKDNEGCFYISLGRKEYFPNANLDLRLGNYVIWLNSGWSEIIEEYNVRIKSEPEQYNFHVGQKVSYVYDGEECVGTVKMGNVNPNAMLIFNDNDIATATICIKDEWCDEIIKKYQVKPITITDMETPIEPDFDQQIINAKLEFADKMLFNGNETSLAALQVNQTLKKILSIEKQRKLHNAEQLWKKLRDQVVSDEDDKKFYDMIQDLELYYETKLKPITNTPKEFTSNDGC